LRSRGEGKLEDGRRETEDGRPKSEDGRNKLLLIFSSDWVVGIWIVV